MISVGNIHKLFIARSNRDTIMAAMTCSALLPSRFQLDPFSHHEVKVMVSATSIPKYIRRKNKYLIVHAQSSSNSFWEREEERWLREEKRWLREEARWLREEERWRAERETLQAEILSLRQQIQNMQQREQSHVVKEGASPQDLIASLGRVMQSLGRVDASPQAQISNMSSSSSPLSEFNSPLRSGSSVESLRIEGESAETSGIKMAMNVAGGVKVDSENSDTKQAKKKSRRVLRKGCEGEDVKEMQEALLGLGFYSGEDDTEYSSFEGGTESAVKSWQASLGYVEDGTMTVELLAILLGEETLGTGLEEVTNGTSILSSHKEGINGTVQISAVTEVAQAQQTKTSKPDGVEASERRVYLLGENRWEEPQRLINKQQKGTKVDKTARCLSCKGEGKMFCTECEGSGELNVEEQFLEWAEGSKCPYCEGTGFIVCDLCDGKGEKV